MDAPEERSRVPEVSADPADFAARADRCTRPCAWTRCAAWQLISASSLPALAHSTHTRRFSNAGSCVWYCSKPWTAAHHRLFIPLIRTRGSATTLPPSPKSLTRDARNASILRTLRRRFLAAGCAPRACDNKPSVSSPCGEIAT